MELNSREQEALNALAAAGYRAQSPFEEVRATGRAHVQTVETDRGVVWIKHSYRLPPGEEVVLRELHSRWPDRLARLAATWPGGFATETLAGEELRADHPEDHWVRVASSLGELLAGEVRHVGDWLALGVRDRRAPTWSDAVAAFRAGPLFRGLEQPVIEGFERFQEDFIERFVNGFRCPATLVPQDSGCCNIHVTDSAVLFYDWADVVIGHPTFSCDRLLDQAPAPMHAAITAAFIEPLGLPLEEYKAMRRSNVLHEVLRYHDELEYMSADDKEHGHLSRAIRSQVKVLVEFEAAKQARG